MKNQEKLKNAYLAFQGINTDYGNESEGLEMCITAMQQMSNIIDLQRARIAELEFIITFG